MATNLLEEIFVKNRLFTLTVLLMAGILCFNIGCRRKKGGTAGSSGADNISGIGDLGDLSAEGWESGRPENMQIISGLNFENVQFEYDSTHISASERGKIEAVSDYLRANPKVGVIAEGHCDERGSLEYNMSLGERRALAVRAYLIGLGIDGSIVQTKSYGEEKPLALGSDEASWAQNRRVEFVFYNY